MLQILIKFVYDVNLDAQKIDTVIFCSSRSCGGLELNTFKLAAELRKRGNSIMVFASKNSLIAEKCEQFEIPCRIQPKFLKYFDLFSAWKLAFKLAKLGCKNVITTFHPDLSLLANTKLFNPKINLLHQQHMHIGRKKKDVFHRFRYSKINFWVSPLNLLADDVVRLSPITREKIRIIPLGVDLNKLMPEMPREDYRNQFGIKPHDILFGLIGRIDRQKGQLLALKAMNMLGKQENVKLLFAGEKSHSQDNYYDEMNDFIKKNSLDERVIFASFMDNVANVMNAIDCLIMASSSEAYGMVTLEAMLLKLPVIASANGGTLELTQYGKYAELFTTRDSAKLADAMKLFLKNPEPFRNKTNAAFEYALNFTLEKECSEIETLLKQQ